MKSKYRYLRHCEFETCILSGPAEGQKGRSALKRLALNGYVVLIHRMPNDNDTGPDETQTAENLFTGLPSFDQFPDEILSKWVALPADQPIAAPLTKKDIDNLLFALLRTNDAHLAIDQTLVKWSTGDLNGANLHLAEFRRLTIESQNRTRRFFAAIMRHATREL